MPQNGPEGKRPSLCRANSAKFIERLCKYPGDPRVIKEAEQHILAAHAARLTEETENTVTVEDIIEERAPRPRVLDMFAGGGSIPLETLRLGCDAYALDLNPVAYIIELCTLVYPQKYGKPDKNAKGSAKDGTWAGLAEEVKYWGNEVLKQVKEEIGDLYPPIPANILKKRHKAGETKIIEDDDSTLLTPVAYLWTRTVKCKKPGCGAIVPLVRQTWLCKKDKRYVAMKMNTLKGENIVKFEVIEEKNEQDLGFDPTDFSSAGNTKCPFCQTVVDTEYIKAEGNSNRIDDQLMAIVCIKKGTTGKIYFSVDEVIDFIPNNNIIKKRLQELHDVFSLDIPNEPIEANPRSMDTQYYGINYWQNLFNLRQKLCLLTFIKGIRNIETECKIIILKIKLKLL
jgi:putative DNA methylase